MKNQGLITKDEYEAIKNTGLNFREIADKYIKEDELEHLQFQKVLGLKACEGGSFANYSSFAYWYDEVED